MAESSDQIKDQTKVSAQPAVASSGDELLSDESLDALILEADPEFAKSVSGIAGEKADSDLNIEMIDLDRLLAEEEARSLKSRARRFWENFKIRAINFLVSLQQMLIYFFREGVPKLLVLIKNKIGSFFGFINETMRQFKYKPVKFKLGVFGFIGLIGLTGYYISRAVKHKVVPEGEPLFFQSLEEMSNNGTQSWVVEEDGESFYDSVRSSSNLILIPKVTVNIRPSAGSGANPMAACELYIEGNSPDVVVEIKDREVEIKDAIQRDIEELSFDQISSPDGKRFLTEKIRRTLNQILSKGKLKKVYFNTLVIKP